MRIGIISDIHSDLPALDSALKILSARGYDKLVCLGDIGGDSYHYKENLEGRNSDDCIKLIKQYCHKVIAGNHDMFWSMRLPDYLRKSKYPDNWYKLNLKEGMNFSNNSIWLYDDEVDEPILADNINFLSSLPETCVMDCGKFSILFTHFLYPDLTGSSKFTDELLMIRSSGSDSLSVVLVLTGFSSSVIASCLTKERPIFMASSFAALSD
mgnify:CR=1 FL=1